MITNTKHITRTRHLNANWSVSKRTSDNNITFYSVNNEGEGHICGLFEYWTDLIKDLKKSFSEEDIKRISKLQND